MWMRFLNDYGMLLVLIALCAVFSVGTFEEQSPVGAGGGEAAAAEAVGRTGDGAAVLIVVGTRPEDRAFASAADRTLTAAGRTVVATVSGAPVDARKALQALAASGRHLDAVVATPEAGQWAVLDDLPGRYPPLGEPTLVVPAATRWPTFLRATNLLNIANQIAVIAIMAIGMTMVVVTGGIDLSVGSLLALSAVVATLLIRGFAGAEEATTAGMAVCCLAAVAMCGAVGLLNGVLVAVFRLPAFIATLGMMLIGSGLALRLAGGQSIFEVPEGFTWLGRESFLGLLPNAVVLMLALYAAAHVVMTRTVLGRYVYAVGGNAEAARLAGVPVQAVVIAVYGLSAALAGLGGVITASQLKSGSPTYGQWYELYVIAAVVVGGASLSGGEGRVFGTLIGALLIAVIQNGMNLLGLTSEYQRIVLGGVIVGAVLLDRLKHYRWAWVRRGRARGAE